MRDRVFPESWGVRFERLGIVREYRDSLDVLERGLANATKRLWRLELIRDECAEQGFAATVARVAQLPWYRGEVWEADVRRDRAFMKGEAGPVRPWLVLVASRTRDLLLARDCVPDRPGFDLLAELLLMAACLEEGKPERVDLADADIASSLAALLRPAGIEVSASPPGVPTIDRHVRRFAALDRRKRR